LVDQCGGGRETHALPLAACCDGQVSFSGAGSPTRSTGSERFR
jgi:hypothetical protein